MKQFPSTLWVSLFLQFGCSVGLTDAYRQEAAKKLVVALSVPSATGDDSAVRSSGEEPVWNASGIIIGADQQRLYVLTARHALGERPGEVLVGSSLWKKGPIRARVRPLDSAALDIALLEVPRIQLALPEWRVWTPRRGLRIGDTLTIIGSQHGLKTEEAVLATVPPKPNPDGSAACGVADGSKASSTPAEAKVSARVGPDPNYFKMQVLVPPTAGDSGGGVFAGPSWELVGLYPGCAHSFEGLHMDRALEAVRSAEFGREIPISLAPPPYRPDFPTWVGAAIVLTGVGFGATAYWIRQRHYDDPERSAALVTPFNITADALMVVGATVLIYQAIVYIRSRTEEHSARERWFQ